MTKYNSNKNNDISVLILFSTNIFFITVISFQGTSNKNEVNINENSIGPSIINKMKGFIKSTSNKYFSIVSNNG